MRATDEFHPGVENINKVGNLLEVAKRGGTAEVDAYRFRPHIRNYPLWSEVMGIFV